MKKNLKALVTTFAAVFAFLAVFGLNSMTANAETHTMSVRYMGSPVNAWCWQYGSEYNISNPGLNIAIIGGYITEGDHVVIYPGDSTSVPDLNLGTKKLGSLTLHQNAHAVITFGGASECYVLSGAYAAIHGSVDKAVAYDATNVSFYDNVGDLMYYFNGSKASNITVGGTVGYFHSFDEKANAASTEYYNVEAGAFKMTNGTDETPEAKRSATASASAPSKADGEYDKVPKTADSNVTLYLLLGASACLAGGLLLRKKEN